MIATVELILFFAHLHWMPVATRAEERVGMFRGGRRRKRPRHQRLRG